VPAPLSTPAAARAVAGLQLRRRLRNRSALLQGVVAPVVLALIVSAAFGGGGATFATTIGVVDADDSDLASGLAAGTAASEGEANEAVTVVDVGSEEAARASIDDGDIEAAVVIPDGFTDSLTGEPAALRVLVDPGRELPGDVARAIADQLAARVDTARLAVTSAVSADPALAGDPGVDALAVDAAAVDPPVTLGDSAFGGGFEPITYFAPSMAILFAFLTLGAGARALIVERREGTLQRVRSAPVHDRAVLAGVTASTVLVGLVSFLAVWLVTALAFGADWGDPVGVVAVIVATVLAVAGISTLVTALARTEAQADGASAVLAFGFALVGGGFISPGDLPDLLRSVALLTPNRWALDAFAELSVGAGAASVVPAVAVLGTIGLVTGAVGVARVRLGVS
jgi:ABC-2 type transport system permease protein